MDRIVIPAPPATADQEHGHLAMTLLPALGSLGSVVLLASSVGAGSRGYLTAGLFLLPSLGFLLVQLDQQRRQRRAPRRAYLRRLAQSRRQLRAAAAEQRSAPSPPGTVRYATGPRPLDVAVEWPDLEDADPRLARAVRRLAVHQTVPDSPLALPLAGRLDVVGRHARDAARAIVSDAAGHHRPDQLRIGIWTTPRRLPQWDWVKWLPHARSTDRADAAGPVRLVATDRADLDVVDLLVVDGPPAPASDSRGTTVLVVDDPADGVLIDADDPATNRLSLAEAEAAARRLARCDTADLEDLLARTAAPLSVPIGLDQDGQPVILDLREAAAGGMGPHGLVVGATGSGKSELLRTLVTGLALTHPPEQLNLVLVDFKGGATFAGLETLPHVAALITNLEAEAALVDRMQDALLGELVRRQELLRSAGAASAAEHPGLATLLIVVDEFSELLATRPEYVDVFVALGRLGRSLGVHLLLASQRLEEGRLRGLEAHLSYRIALRTFSAAESRSALGVPDAFELPRTPGAGYLASGPGAPRRFQALRARASSGFDTEQIVAFSVLGMGPTSRLRDEIDLPHHGARAHPIWLPPLDVPDDLESLAPGLAVGTVDRPREQRRDPLVLDLSGAGGNAAVVGGPRSGTSSLLSAVVLQLARTTTPDRTRILLLDPAGSLATLARLPHVAAHARRPDDVHRVGATVAGLLAGRMAGRSDEWGEVYVVVDGWGTLRDQHPETAERLEQVAARGLTHRLHLIVAAHRWGELRPALRDALGTRLELRLGDPTESQVDRRLAASVPARPGHGLVPSGHRFLAARPAADLADRIAASWRGPVGPSLAPLPTHIRLSELPPGPAIRIGAAPEPVCWDEGHLLAYGDPGSGRTTLLRAIAHEIVRLHPPAAAQIVVVSPRRTLLGDVPDEHLLGRLASEPAAELTELADRLRRRRHDGPTGPTAYVLVDDHELLSPGALAPLLPLLPYSTEVGLRLAVVRRASGAARAALDPDLRALRDLGATGLLLSGPPDEGPLLGGVRPVPLPPGRARLVTRAGVETVQLAECPPRRT